MRSSRSLVLACASLLLLGGPSVLAFFAGGYFDEPRAWAGAVAWGLVAVAALAGGRVHRPPREVLLAFAGLLLFGLWTLISFTWSPISGTAFHDGQRVLAYLGALLAGFLLLRDSRLPLVIPVLLAGTVIVVGYGIAARLLPGVLHFQASGSARGRLEQPLTYWNAMGALAAIGLVLAARLAGERTRESRLRIFAAACSAPLGLGLYLTFSRGAIFACASGLIVLVTLDPRRWSLRALILCTTAAVVCSAAAAPLDGVTALQGGQHHREVQGLVLLPVLVMVSAAAALIQARWAREEAGEASLGPVLRLPRHIAWGAAGAILVAFTLFILVGAKERSNEQATVGATRLTTLQSNRYQYWRVAWLEFQREPLRGVGGGGWAVDWERLRRGNAGAQDAHSLPIQTAAEFGAVGLLLLGMFTGGVALAARRAWVRHRTAATGAIAGCVVWGCHATIDWDWEMPALTAVAILLAASLLALSSRELPEAR